MFGSNITNTLTLTRILGGIYKGLGILNQAIPLYKEIKPMIGSARKVMSVLQDLKIPNNIVNETKTTNNNYNKKTIDADAKEKQIGSQSAPVFFQ